MTHGFGRFLGLVALAASFALGSARAQNVEEFYRGNVIELYVGFTVGAGYDVYGRMVARHLGKHIPGNPTVVPLNMEGAGSLKLTNWLYNAAPRDGTVLAVIARGIPFEPLVGIAPTATLRFDATKFNWIGNTSEETSVCVAWERAGIDRFEQLYEKELIVGGVGAGGDPDVFPLIIAGVTGAKFRIVSGYPGGADLDFALERGEIDGRCGWSWTSITSTNQDWLNDGKIKILLQLSRTADPDLTARGVPWVMDLAKNDEDRQIFQLIFSRGALGRPFVASPGVPADRVAALRKAFDDTMLDPEFLEEARRSRIDVSPMSGAEIQQLLMDVYATPQPIIDRARAMLRPG